MSREGGTAKAAVPKGFLFRVASAGIKTPGRIDLAAIVSDRPAVAAGMYTTNAVKAAPVRLGMRRIASGRARAIVVNSGNANACTGVQGMKDARETARLAARAFGLGEADVHVCSTGVIGAFLPMDRIRAGVQGLGEGKDVSIRDAARAIMTTDTYPKVRSERFRLDGRLVTIAGIAKGAGMIAPNMATMLGFVVTDAALTRGALEKSLRSGVARSFNRLTVDGDRSTNDTVLVLANGAAGNRLVSARPGDAGFERFREKLGKLLYDLARMIADDGEGARHCIEVVVTGARSARDAETAAMAVANSNLVKTAVYGRDANWGRIVCALGYSGARIREERVGVAINGVRIVERGITTGKDAAAAKAMARRDVEIRIDLGLGSAEARALTCDFTEDYVRINAEYRT